MKKPRKTKVPKCAKCSKKAEFHIYDLHLCGLHCAGYWHYALAIKDEKKKEKYLLTLLKGMTNE